MRITFDELDCSTDVEHPPLELLYGKTDKQIELILSSYYFKKLNLPESFITSQYSLPLYIDFDSKGSSVGFRKFEIGKILGKTRNEIFNYLKA
jgi:hypothetical protein